MAVPNKVAGECISETSIQFCLFIYTVPNLLVGVASHPYCSTQLPHHTCTQLMKILDFLSCDSVLTVWGSVNHTISSLIVSFVQNGNGDHLFSFLWEF